MMKYDPNESIEDFLKKVNRDIEMSKCLQEWIHGICSIYPLLSEIDIDGDKARNKSNKAIMNKLRNNGVEMSLEETNTFNDMFEKTLDIIRIFDENYEIWQAKGKTIAENNEREGKHPYDDLNDILGF